MTRRIIQFGTSRFLQAHVDLFVHEARQAGQDVGPITVVKTTAGAERSGRIRALKQGVPYPVRVRGVAANGIIDETVEVASVDSAFDAQHEWPAVIRAFAREAEIAVSNVGDRGFERSPLDVAQDDFAHAPPAGFPAKLLALLVARFRDNGRPLIFLPTELISGNGRRLAGVVSSLAEESGQPDSFRDWLARAVVFADTLVDRIVSESIEPVGAVTEPYALWAICNGCFAEPFKHPAVRMVDDIAPFERLKLHILNLGHTVLADIWRKEGGAEDETVRAILEDKAVFGKLVSIYAEEVVPGFALHQMGGEAQRYVETTLERFRNPFLEHRLSDIHQNHAAKITSRVAGFLEWARRRDPAFTASRLSDLLRSGLRRSSEAER